MITALSLFVFLLSGTSMLVEEGHEHNWKLITGLTGGELWVDQNWSNSFEQDGEVYPLRLFRMKNAIGAYVAQADLKFAFDCPNRQLGVRTASAIIPGTSKPHIEELDPVIFDFIEGEPSDEDEQILKIVCGEAPAS